MSSTPSRPSSSTPATDDRKSSISSQSRNPVSLRLYKVLGTSFDDQATREALQTLSDLYANTERKVDGPVAEEEVESLENSAKRLSISKEAAHGESIPGETANRARKNLRRDMEKQLAEGSHHFLQIFKELDSRLSTLQTHITAMHKSCDEAEKQLQLTNEVSKTLLERAGSLRDERQEVEVKQSIISLFLSRFTLTEDEVEAITSRDVAVGKRFFMAMDKTEKVRDDCRVLMAGEEGPTKAGLDIMSTTSSYLEQGYEKILRWCSYEFLQVGRDTQLEVSSVMREAVSRLRKRPELLGEALSSLSQTRQSALQSSFLTALTRGGPSGLPRPIELHAHDPMRYIGDMLAWVHQAIAAEREFLEGLFGIKSDGRMVGSVRAFHEKMNEEELRIRELMDEAVKRLCVPLQGRVQQTVKSQESSIMTYKIANLLQFYTVTMQSTIGPGAVLSTTLRDITDIAYKSFYDAIETQCRALLRIGLENEDPSLTPPVPIIEHVQVLREIMSVYHSSLLGDEDADDQIAGFEKVLDTMIDPAIQMCINGAQQKKAARPRWDMQVFVLNCLSYLLSSLEPFEFTQAKRKIVQSIIDERVEILTDEHYHDIMLDAGLEEIATVCQKHDDSEPLSHIPATQPSQLQAALRNFSHWLSGPEVVHSPRLSLLTVQRLHTKIHHAALARMAKAYGVICEQVRRKENRYEAASTLLGSERPFGQVGLVWQIFGLQEDGDGSEGDNEKSGGG
ncbi:conserved oligomeric golgi complex subunit 6 [Moniliophthora roreri]|uniref:Conserved oligomeric Golgi complex subunit 6 n=1 Tax=Moniliophthora roreri TaxID=221103 RepID=A0A0W0ETE6_MONRR|nr:conserved oligomeric golgi complex subunit 6 [Moniliophthora roreri]